MARVQHHTAGQLYHALIDYEIIKQLKDLKGVGHPRGIHAFRNVYEDYDGRESCIIVRGPIIKGKTVCYLSGLLIDSSDPGLKEEGEHLLPVYKAIAYLSLIYKSDKLKRFPNGKRDPKVTKAQILEFDWACRVANQEKSDTDYTKVENGQFRTNEDAIVNDLRKMWGSKRADAVKFRKELEKKYKTEEKFISNRLPYLKMRFDEICQYINGEVEQGDAPLMHLAGLARIIDAEIPANVRNLIRASPHPHLFPERTVEERQEARNAEIKLLRVEAKNDARREIDLLFKPSVNVILNAAGDIADEQFRETANLFLEAANNMPNRSQKRRRITYNNRGGKRKSRKNVKVHNM
jgi:hypothetical protein